MGKTDEFKGLCNLGPRPTAFTGGALVAATGFDLLFPVPIYQRAVHWGLGGLVAPYVLQGQEITIPKDWNGYTKFGMGVLGGGSYYTALYFVGRVLGS